jgi:hypothetical protein
MMWHAVWMKSMQPSQLKTLEIILLRVLKAAEVEMSLPLACRDLTMPWSMMFTRNHIKTVAIRCHLSFARHVAACRSKGGCESRAESRASSRRAPSSSAYLGPPVLQAVCLVRVVFDVQGFRRDGIVGVCLGKENHDRVDDEEPVEELVVAAEHGAPRLPAPPRHDRVDNEAFILVTRHGRIGHEINQHPARRDTAAYGQWEARLCDQRLAFKTRVPRVAQGRREDT